MADTGQVTRRDWSVTISASIAVVVVAVVLAHGYVVPALLILLVAGTLGGACGLVHRLRHPAGVPHLLLVRVAVPLLIVGVICLMAGLNLVGSSVLALLGATCVYLAIVAAPGSVSYPQSRDAG